MIASEKIKQAQIHLAKRKKNEKKERTRGEGMTRHWREERGEGKEEKRKEKNFRLCDIFMNTFDGK